MKEAIERFCIRNKASLWLLFFSWGISSTMMDPNFINVVIVLINFAILFTMRLVAHIEGRLSGK